MSEEKTMKEEMNEEITDLVIENIHKMIPEEWMPRINEILPKILNIVKTSIKKNIKDTAESLGNNKMFITMNWPHELKDASMIMVPTMFRIDKSQLGPSTYDEATGNYEFSLKDGEVPEAQFSMMTIAEKINSYDSVEKLFKDIKEGKFITLDDIHYTGDRPQENALPEGSEQKSLNPG